MNLGIPKNNKKQISSPIYYKYLGLSFQLFIFIGLGMGLGWWLDQKTEMKFPLWLLICSFLAVFMAFYFLWVSLKNDQ